MLDRNALSDYNLLCLEDAYMSYKRLAEMFSGY
jgi:hypothetical protein